MRKPRSQQLQTDFGDISGANLDTFSPKQANIALKMIQNFLATKPLTANKDRNNIKSGNIVSITDNLVLLISIDQ